MRDYKESRSAAAIPLALPSPFCRLGAGETGVAGKPHYWPRTNLATENHCYWGNSLFILKWRNHFPLLAALLTTIPSHRRWYLYKLKKGTSYRHLVSGSSASFSSPTPKPALQFCYVRPSRCAYVYSNSTPLCVVVNSRKWEMNFCTCDTHLWVRRRKVSRQRLQNETIDSEVSNSVWKFGRLEVTKRPTVQWRVCQVVPKLCSRHTSFLRPYSIYLSPNDNPTFVLLYLDLPLNKLYLL